MLYSMTGYGKSHLQNEQWFIELQIRTVNNRYFDFHSKIPSDYLFCETFLKKKIQEHIARGRIDVVLKVQPTQGRKPYQLQEETLHSLVQQVLQFQKQYTTQPQLPMDTLLSLDGILTTELPPIEEEQFLSLLDTVASECIQRVLTMRSEEGERLGRNLQEKIEAIELERQYIQTLCSEFVSQEKKRMEERLGELTQTPHIDEHFLEMELALYAQKVDIDEELVRLDSHLHAFQTHLQRGGNIGKTLDFLVQEMNREVNTMASKSNDQRLSQACVRNKTTIEQIREQIQNLE